MSVKKILLLLQPQIRADSVAQLVEQRPFKPWVLGSNPSGITDEYQSPNHESGLDFFIVYDIELTT